MLLSNSELTKLGDRLRRDRVKVEDLVALDEFRQTFSEIDKQAYSIIQEAIQNVLSDRA